MDAVDASHAFLDAQRIPRFRIHPHDVSILDSPTEFYESIISQIKTANSRVVLASLYIGTSEIDLINAIKERLETSSTFKVTFLIDYYRGSRGFVPLLPKIKPNNDTLKSNDLLKSKNVDLEHPKPPPFPMDSIELISSLAAQYPNRVNLSLYRTPAMSNDWLSSLLPPRFNEVVGLQHMKIYVVDNNCIVSGANLNRDYFTNRQDRYVLFKDAKGLTDYYSDLVNAISKFSYPVSFDKVTAAKLYSSHYQKDTSNKTPLPLEAEDILKLRTKATSTLFENSRDNRLLLDPPILLQNGNRTEFGTLQYQSLVRRYIEQFNEKWYLWTTSRRHFISSSDLNEESNQPASDNKTNNEQNNQNINAKNNHYSKISNDYYSASYNGTVTVFPLLQMGQFGIKQEEEVIHGLFNKLTRLAARNSLIPSKFIASVDPELIRKETEQHLAAYRYRLVICSGYLNFPEEFIKMIFDYTYEYKLFLTRFHNGLRSTPAHQSFESDPLTDTIIVTSAPEANGFFNSKGVSKYLPPAYTFLEKRLLKSERKYIERHSSVGDPLSFLNENNNSNSSTSSGTINPIPQTNIGSSLYQRLQQIFKLKSIYKPTDNRHLVRILEYNRNKWTWHAKGLWLIGPSDVTSVLSDSVNGNVTKSITKIEDNKPNASNSFLCVVGSSNYGYRSQSRDIESQLIIVARKEKDLTMRIKHNLFNVLLKSNHNNDISLNTLNSDAKRRVPYLVSLATSLIRKML